MGTCPHCLAPSLLPPKLGLPCNLGPLFGCRFDRTPNKACQPFSGSLKAEAPSFSGSLVGSPVIVACVFPKQAFGGV